MNKLGLALSFVAGMAGCDGCPPTKMATNDSLQNIAPAENTDVGGDLYCDAGEFYEIAADTVNKADRVMADDGTNREPITNCMMVHQSLQGMSACLEHLDLPYTLFDRTAGHMVRRLREVENQVIAVCGPEICND